MGSSTNSLLVWNSEKWKGQLETGACSVTESKPICWNNYTRWRLSRAHGWHDERDRYYFIIRDNTLTGKLQIIMWLASDFNALRKSFQRRSGKIWETHVASDEANLDMGSEIVHIRHPCSAWKSWTITSKIFGNRTDGSTQQKEETEERAQKKRRLGIGFWSQPMTRLFLPFILNPWWLKIT